MEYDSGPTVEGAVIPALAAAPSSVACLRSLGRRGIKTIAVSEHDDPPGFNSKYADETIPVPDPATDLEGYGDALLALARRDDVSTVVPVREADVYALAKRRDAFADNGVTPTWPSIEGLRQVQDRVELFAAAERADVGTPETATLDEWDDWSQQAIVKPRFTMNAEEYHEDFEESQRHDESTSYVPAGEEPSTEEYVDEMGHVPLVQEFVPDSDEYAFFALYDEGDPVATFQHRQRRGYKFSGGPSSYRQSVDIPELDGAGRRLLGELDWHGLAMVEFLRDPETGEFKLMEINPRFWTSLPFTIQAGVDLPYYYWQLATGRRQQIDDDYDVGVAGHLLRGELLFLHSILAEEDNPHVERPSLSTSLYEIGSSMVRHPRFDVFSVDDPGPFVRDMRNIVDSVLEGSYKTH